MTGASVGLTIAYGALATLLLSLNLRSAWRWPVKALAIGAVLPFFVSTFLALQALSGWPADAPLPDRFRLHAALVEEPAVSSGTPGAIHLWLTPATGEPEAFADAGPPPRAFTLPYSRELHQKIDALRERMRKGDMVVGRSTMGPSRQRRFGRQDGSIDLYAPPPPPLPAKDGR